jgi:2-oxoglutarate dehydrogenase E2 component (dihydrolipoamide succinyltransferase)
MALEVKIPPMGESISSGILAKWHVKDGSAVKKDQPLFELETDKITSEGTAEAAGVITFKVEAGAEVKIGQVVATIEPGGASAQPAEPAAASEPAPASPAPAPAAPAPVPTPAPAPAPQAAVPSPAVRRISEETGVDPAGVAGTGKAGRVTKGDILAAVQAPAKPAAAPQPKAAPASGERQTRRKLSPLRQRIAERLVSAQHGAALLTTFNEVNMAEVMALRSKYQEDFVKKNGLKLGFMSFFVKAVVQALKEIPSINSQLEGDTLVQNHYYDIGVAVSTEKGLMVPVIRDCDSLGMAGVEKAIADMAARAREGRITLADLEGGVFTITNGGTFGSLLSTPIINPPQSAILGMHAINERPVAIAGQVVIRPMMYIALTYDHRVIDGREAVTFLVKVKQEIEDPSRLLLGL